MHSAAVQVSGQLLPNPEIRQQLKQPVHETERPTPLPPSIRATKYARLGLVAAQAGISREALYRLLSPKGNPTLKTLLAVLKTVGMRLSVEPEHHAHA